MSNDENEIVKIKPNKDKKKIFKFALGVVLAFLIIISGMKIPILDSLTDCYFNDSITKAGLSYATCRGINALVSILLESELQIGPGGVGVTIALGQALDPIDDMTERLSDVLVTAVTSLGVQKLLYEISVSLTFPILFILLIIYFLLKLFNKEFFQNNRKKMIKILLLFFVIRLCLPISAIVNSYLYNFYFDDKIVEARDSLEMDTNTLDEIKKFTPQESNGLFSSIKNGAELILDKTIQLKKSLSETMDKANIIIENLLKLTFLYVGLFVVQVIILPVASFWILIKLANSIFEKDMPVILNQKDMSKNINKKLKEYKKKLIQEPATE